VPLGYGFEILYQSFWTFFGVMVRVVDRATAQQVLWIIAAIWDVFPHFSLVGDLWYQGMYLEGKQAQIGLRLPGSGPETPSKTVWFRNVKISALISPCLPKYGSNGLEKRRVPRPFKARFVLPGALPVLGEICPTKGRYRGRFSDVPLFLRDMARNKGVIYEVFKKWG
jgi:hypothetical protein